MKRKKIFKALSAFLVCMAVTSTSAMAMTTSEVKEKAEKTLGLNNCKSIVQVENAINKKSNEIDKLLQANNKKNTTKSVNEAVSKVTVARKTYNPYDPNSKVPFTVFGVWEYSDASDFYQEPDHIIYKSKLPLKMGIYQEGNGNLMYIKIDGVITYAYTKDKNGIHTNPAKVIDIWNTDIVFDNDTISKLANGRHTIEVAGMANDGYSTSTNIITDTCTFYIAD